MVKYFCNALIRNRAYVGVEGSTQSIVVVTGIMVRHYYRVQSNMYITLEFLKIDSYTEDDCVITNKYRL